MSLSSIDLSFIVLLIFNFLSVFAAIIFVLKVLKKDPVRKRANKKRIIDGH
jgi:uncharacterized protein YpmS